MLSIVLQGRFPIDVFVNYYNMQSLKRTREADLTFLYKLLDLGSLSNPDGADLHHFLLFVRSLLIMFFFIYYHMICIVANCTLLVM